MSVLRLGVLPDFPEEHWPSMDLCAEMLLREINPLADRIEATRICPPYKHHFRLLPWVSRNGAFRNADRLLNRMRHYPRFARNRAREFDLFHLCDHSYAQLVHELPADRTGVLCHDLDTFRCLLDPASDPRPKWFRKMMSKILGGLQKAAIVFYTTATVREQIERFEVIDPARLVQVPLGTCEEFTADGPVAQGCGPYILHVGSEIARKRIDVLLNVMAGLRKVHPSLRLEQVGGNWTISQRNQIEQLGLGEAVRQRRGLSRSEVAALYRGAKLVLITSEAEGFGLPVIEALACGAAIVASDIPVLREVGGEAACYCPVGDVPMWVQTATRLLNDPTLSPPTNVRLNQAAKYSWQRHATVITRAYERLNAGQSATMHYRAGHENAGLGRSG